MHFKTNQLKFSLKLILSQSAILVEYPGHEPQLFMPTLVHNKIVLRNIIFDHINPPDSDEKPKHQHLHKRCRSEADTVKLKRKGKRQSSSTSGDNSGVCGQTNGGINHEKTESQKNEHSESMHSPNNTDSRTVPPNIDSLKSEQLGDNYNGKTLKLENDRFNWVRSGKTKKSTPLAKDKLNSSEKSMPIVGAAIEPSIADYHERLQLQLKKVHSHVIGNSLPPFDGLRSSYLNKEFKSARTPGLKKRRTLDASPS